jgi:hypothetical protein
MLTDWVHLAGQDWKERVASWFQGSGCAARVLHLKTFDPPAYAEEWLRYTEPGNAEAADALFERWMEYYKSEGIEAISRGIIMVRRSERARNWVRFDEAPRHMGPFSDYVQRSFAVGDFLEGASSNDLLEQRLRLSKDVRLRQVLEPGGNGWNVALARFELTIGPHYEGSVDRFVLALVGRCDGLSKLRDLFGELASGMGADPHRVIPACLPIVRQMLGHGVLLPEQVAAAGS